MLGDVDTLIGIDLDHAVVGGNDNQRALGRTPAQQMQLRVHPLECRNPMVRIPPVIMPDLISVPDVQVCQPRLTGGLARQSHPVGRPDAAVVVRPAQRGTGERGIREFRQSDTGHPHTATGKRLKHGRHPLQILWVGGVAELDELTQLPGCGVALRIPGHAGQPRAGTGSKGRHGRHRGGRRTCADRPAVHTIGKQRAQIWGMSDP